MYFRRIMTTLFLVTISTFTFASTDYKATQKNASEDLKLYTQKMEPMMARAGIYSTKRFSDKCIDSVSEENAPICALSVFEEFVFFGAICRKQSPKMRDDYLYSCINSQIEAYDRYVQNVDSVEESNCTQDALLEIKSYPIEFKVFNQGNHINTYSYEKVMNCHAKMQNSATE